MFKTALGLMLAGVLFGDGLGLLGLAWVMWRDRRKGRVFGFLAALFLSLTMFMLLWISAASEVPAEARPTSYRWGVLAAASVLALGVWPTVLHIVFGLWHRLGVNRLEMSSGEQPNDFWIERFSRIEQVIKDERLTSDELRTAVRGELQDFFKNK